MREPPDIPDTPLLPMDGDGPVFKAPWEAQAFALVLDLFDKGHFKWPEWVEQLSAEIAGARHRGEPDPGDDYYQHWLTALEKIVAAKGLATDAELARRKADWKAADHARAFGEPPVLKRGAGTRFEQT